MLVIDVDALLAVNLLDLAGDIAAHALAAELVVVDAADAEHLMRVQRTGGHGLAAVDMVAVVHLDAGAVRDKINLGLALRLVGDGQGVHDALLGLLDGHGARNLSQDGHFLGLAGLEKLFNTGKTLGDVVARDAAGVEGTHGQLRARLADGLRRDDADRFAHVDGAADGEVDAVALGTDAGLGFAGHDAADEGAVDAVGLQNGGVGRHQHMIGVKEHFAGFGIGDRLCREAAVNGGGKVLDQLAAVVLGLGPDALLGTAVLLTDDDVLADVDHAAGQVTGVGGTKRRIGHALSGATGGDEVLQNGEAFTEVGLDGDLDGLTGGVRHQTAHTGQLTDLVHRAAGAGVGHHVDRVILVQSALQGVRDLLGGGLPLGDDQAVAFVLGDEAALVLAFDVDDLVLGLRDETVLFIRHGHVGDRDGDGALGGILVAHRLDAVEHLGRDGEAVLLDAAVDDVAQLLLADLEADLIVERLLGIAAVDIAQILRDILVEDDAADGRGDDAALLGAVHRFGDAQADRGMQADVALVVGHDGLVGIAVDEKRLVFRLRGALLGRLEIQGIELVAVHHGIGLKAGVARVGDQELFGALLFLADADHRQVVGAEDHILGRNRNGMAVLRTQEVVGRQHQHSRLGLGLGAQRHVNGHLVTVKVGVVRGADQRVQTQCAAFHQDRLESLDAEAVQGRRAVEQDRMLLDDVLQGVPDLGLLLVDHLFGGLDVVGDAVLNQLLHDEGAEQFDRHLLGHAALIDLEIRADDDNASAGVVDTLAQQVLTEAALLALEHVAEGFERAGVGAGNGTAAAAVVDEGVHGLLQHALLIAHDDVGSVELHQPLQTVVAVDDAAVEVVEVGGRKAAAVQLDHGTDFRRDDREDGHDHPLRAVAALAEGLDDLEALDQLGLFLAAGIFELFTQLLGQSVAVDLLEQLLNGLGADAGLKIVLIFLTHLAVFALGQDLAALERGEAGVDDNVVGKIQDLFQHTRGQIQHQAHAAGDALEVPDVADRGGKLDMAHALTAHLALGDLDAAAVADLALIADLLVLAAVAFPVLGGSENAFAVQAVTLGLEGTVVDGLGLFDLAVGPFEYLLRRGNADLNGIKRCITHHSSSSAFSAAFSL